AGVRNHRAVFPELILKTAVEVKTPRTHIPVNTEDSNRTRAERNVQELTVYKNSVVQGCSSTSAESAMSTDAADETDLTCGLNLSLFDVLPITGTRHDK